MAGVFQNIDPPPSPPPGECVPPAFSAGGRTHSLVGEGGGGSIFWKTSDTALYSSYVSTLWPSRWIFILCDFRCKKDDSKQAWASSVVFSSRSIF
jgi:hypothetical protein